MDNPSYQAFTDEQQWETWLSEHHGDPDDARATRVRLTARGRSYARAIRTLARDVEAEWADRIGAQRIAQLKETLELLRTEVFAADDGAEKP